MSDVEESSFLIPNIEKDGEGFTWTSINDESKCQELSQDQDSAPRIPSHVAVAKPIRELIDLYEKAKTFEGNAEKTRVVALKLSSKNPDLASKNSLIPKNASEEPKFEDLEVPNDPPMQTMEGIVSLPDSSESPPEKAAQLTETDDYVHVESDPDEEYVNRTPAEIDSEVDDSEEAFEKTFEDSEFKHVLKTAAQKAKSKTIFQKLLREMTDFIPTALHKIAGDVKDAVDDFARDLANVTSSLRKQVGSSTSKALKLEYSPDSRVQIVRDDQELKQKLAEAGDKIVIAFICLDSILTREVVIGKFLPKFEEMAVRNEHLTFLTISERDLSSLVYTASCRWNVPSFVVFQNGLELNKLSVEFGDMKDYLKELEDKLQALIQEYEVTFDPTILAKNWTSLFATVDYENKYDNSGPGSIFAVESYDMLEQYLVDAGSRIVILTLFPLVPEWYYEYRKHLKNLKKMALQNPDKRFMFTFLQPKALSGSSGQKFIKVLFYQNSKIYYGENWYENVFPVGDLNADLISKFKAHFTLD